MNTQILLTFSEDEFKSFLVDAIKQAIAEVRLNKTEDKFMTCKETSEFLRISLRTVNKYMNDGRIPFHRVGSRVLFSKKELEQTVTRE